MSLSPVLNHPFSRVIWLSAGLKPRATTGASTQEGNEPPDRSGGDGFRPAPADRRYPLSTPSRTIRSRISWLAFLIASSPLICPAIASAT